MVFEEDQRREIFQEYVEVLADVREVNGITKRELAEIVGIHEKHVSHVENMRRIPSVETLLAMMAGAGVKKELAEEFCTNLINKFKWKG